jgi:hypothetical protein
LPSDQLLPAACPACGLILAKAAARLTQDGPAVSARRPVEPSARPGESAAEDSGRWQLLWQVPGRVEPLGLGLRVIVLLAFSVWGLWLAAQDHRDGAMVRSFLHLPLLVFHEAGHVLMRPFGEWLMVLGGTLGQLAMPAVMAGALLLKNRDSFGAALGLWFFGVSLLDVAPYVADALHPQLMLLSGSTGEEGGHDWIYLLASMHLLRRAQTLGLLVRAAGGAIVLLALGWAAAVLWRQAAMLGVARVDGR